MSPQVRPVGIGFTESAPVRLVFAADLTASPTAVYRALADETGSWPEWFTALSAVTVTSSGRTVRLGGGRQFWETVVAAEPGARYAYRVDRTNIPGLRALLEDWRLASSGHGTALRWTVATDGTALYRSVVRLARSALGRAFRDAVRNLDRRLGPPTTR